VQGGDAEAAATPAETLTVTSSQASGPGSVAAAIAQANAYSASTTIQFDVQNVQIASPLAITTSRDRECARGYGSGRCVRRLRLPGSLAMLPGERSGTNLSLFQGPHSTESRPAPTVS
jgi:hypothetical protein